MPSVKRVRPRDESEIVDAVEAASSNLRAVANKRLRLNTIEFDVDRSRETSTASFDPENFASTQYQHHGSIREDWERDRDNVSVLGSDEDEEQLDKATQAIARRRAQQQQQDNTAAECGILESVTCTNFMCHSKLHVNFGPLINFIIGHNGSGKSAVLTAITLCLGGKATSTNRGQNLRSFVKEGTESAVLAVRIKNKGAAAYKQDLYGDSIIVERHFNIHGASTFKIKSREGRIISTKRSELDEISDFYALQLDNPVNVLTQDNARQFLNSSTHADKYKFFIRGVQLEQLDQDYRLVGDCLDNTEYQLDHVKEDLDILKNKALEAHKKWQVSQQQGSLREKISRYTRQMVWVQVEEQERKLLQEEDKLRSARARVEELEGETTVFDERFDEAARALELAQQSIAQLREERAPIDSERTEKQSKVNELREQRTERQADEREMHNALEQNRRAVEKGKKDVQHESKLLEEASSGSEAVKLAEIREAEATFDQARIKSDEHQRSLASLQKEKAEQEQGLKLSKNSMQERQSQHRNAQDQLEKTRANRGNRLAAFNPNLPRLQKAIRDEPRFHEKPVGPIALHITILKPEWTSIVEKYVGGTMNNFIVTSMHDLTILKTLMSRTSCNYNVAIGRKEPIHNLQEPDPEYDTMLRVLKFDNELVKNQLIINQSIEQTVLMERHEAGVQLVMKGSLPRNIKSIICMHPRKKGAGIRLSKGRGGGESSAPVEAWNGAFRVGTDDEAQIRLREEAVLHAREELSEAEADHRSCEKRYQECNQAINRHVRDGKALSYEASRADDRIQELKDELEKIRPRDGALEGLKRNLQEAETAYANVSGQYEDVISYSEQLNEQQRDADDELAQWQDKFKTIEAQIRAAEARVNKDEEKKQKELRRKNEAYEAVESAKREVERAEKDQEDQAGQVKSFTQSASNVCARVPVDEGETGNSLDKKLERLGSDLARYERQAGGSELEISRQRHEAVKACKKAEKQFQVLLDLVNVLKRALLERQSRWEHFRRNITFRARSWFRLLLRNRNFRGNMLVDHVSKQLELQVEPDSTRRQSKAVAGRQTKTLSGGEKSFATICMLLSLWDAMGSPIRCLDEFDVFMDSVNRDISMRMMISAARESMGRQYILITPQAMGSLDLGPDVKVIKLNDPERGQTTLDIPRAS